MKSFVSNLKEYGNLLLWIFLGCYLGLLVVKPNPYFALISFSLPLGLILLKYRDIGFYVILISIFFADWLKGLDLIPDQMTWLPDVILLVFCIKVIFLKDENKGVAKTPITTPVVFFILLGVLSTLINSQHIVTTIIGFRFDLKYVLMFFLLVKLNPDEIFFKRMIHILIVMLVIQIPVAVIKFGIYGQGERAIGTYGVHGGTLSTIIPLIGVSVFLGFSLFERLRFRYLFLILLFVLFSIVGGKRAFVFFGPLLFLFLSWQAGRKNIGKLSSLAPFVMVGFLACVYFVPSLRPAFENPRHLMDFPVDYTTGETGWGEATGRTSAMKVVHRTLTKNTINFLLGFGPGSMSKSYFKEFERKKLRDAVPIAYGKSQWVTMSLEYGYGGTLLFLWLIFPLFKVNQRFFNETDHRYWKAISFGFKGICFAYLMGFFYAKVFRLDVLAFIFWFFAAAIFCLGRQREVIQVGDSSMEPEKLK